MKRAVVGVESLVEAHFAFQKDAADEGGCLISVRPQHRRQLNQPRRHALGIFLDLALERIGGGKQRSMRRKGERNLRFDVTEQGTLLSKRIDVGSVDGAVSVGA